MLNTRHSQQGFTMIELMVGVIVIGILAAVGAPSLRSWVQNAQIRTTAEAIQNGLQLARAGAVHRNGLVRFQLTDNLTSACALSTTSSNWVVSQDDATDPAIAATRCATTASDTTPPRIIQTRSSAEGSSNAVVAAGQSSFIFNGLGRTTNVAATVTITISNTIGGSCTPAGPMRCLNVIVTTGGQIRMCDPAKASTDPQGC